MTAIPTDTIRDVAKALNVSERTVYRWVREHRISAVRLGGRWRLDRTRVVDQLIETDGG